MFCNFNTFLLDLLILINLTWKLKNQTASPFSLSCYQKNLVRFPNLWGFIEIPAILSGWPRFLAHKSIVCQSANFCRVRFHGSADWVLFSVTKKTTVFVPWPFAVAWRPWPWRHPLRRWVREHWWRAADWVNKFLHIGTCNSIQQISKI